MLLIGSKTIEMLRPFGFSTRGKTGSIHDPYCSGSNDPVCETPAIAVVHMSQRPQGCFGRLRGVNVKSDRHPGMRHRFVREWEIEAFADRLRIRAKPHQLARSNRSETHHRRDFVDRDRDRILSPRRLDAKLHRRACRMALSSR